MRPARPSRASGLPSERPALESRAVGRRQRACLGPAAGAELWKAERRCDREDFGGPHARQKRSIGILIVLSLIRILYVYLGWGPLERGALGGRPSRPPPGPGLRARVRPEPSGGRRRALGLPLDGRVPAEPRSTGGA